MQRNEENGDIIISCDFCGTDWDQVRPMMEGHKGSVICLDCLKFALAMSGPAQEAFSCTMCLHPFEKEQTVWRHPDQLAGANAEACLCKGCISQAAGTFSKDPDIDWKRPQAARESGKSI